MFEIYSCSQKSHSFFTKFSVRPSSALKAVCFLKSSIQKLIMTDIMIDVYSCIFINQTFYNCLILILKNYDFIYVIKYIEWFNFTVRGVNCLRRPNAHQMEIPYLYLPWWTHTGC